MHMARREAALIAPIISTAEVLFQPHVEANKKIATSHFSNRQLCLSSPTVAPRDRDRGPRVSTDDRFKRQLDGKIEMWRNQRTAAINYSFAVRLESVCGVVQSDAEKYLQEKIGHSIQNQFHPRIIDHASAFHKTAAKNTFVAFIEFLPVTDDIAAIVGFIRHHN